MQLDVERLAKALAWFDETGWKAFPNYGNVALHTDADDWLIEAEAVAAEYDRLADAPQD